MSELKDEVSNRIKKKQSEIYEDQKQKHAKNVCKEKLNNETSSSEFQKCYELEKANFSQDRQKAVSDQESKLKEAVQKMMEAQMHSPTKKKEDQEDNFFDDMEAEQDDFFNERRNNERP